MSVNSYLGNLSSELVLSLGEKDHISNSISTIKSRLDYYFGSNISDKKVFGSYVRGTTLPRKADSNSDIDLMVVFKNEDGYKPQTFLNRLKDFAEYYYSTSEIYQSSPTVVLELNHIKFELTPAYVSCGLYFIPNGPSKWMYSDPDGFYNKLTKQLSEKEGVTEVLKAENQMLWVQRMNNIRSAAMESVANDLIYC